MNEEAKIKETPSLLSYEFPDEEKETHQIAVERVVEAIKAGKDIEIVNCVIDGDFVLDSVTVEGKVTIRRTKFKGRVDWSYSTFKRVVRLQNSTFDGDVTFTSATFEQDIWLEEATIPRRADFTTVHIMGNAFFFGAKFGARFKEATTFDGAQIDGSAFFPRAKFEGKAQFVITHIGRAANFEGAEFKRKARFQGAQIGDDVFFNLAYFEGEADFRGARIGSNAEFNGAEFKQTVIFNGAQIEGSASFRSAKFEGVGREANFASARIGFASFTGAEFRQRANFNRARIQESAIFRLAKFEEEADFGGARIGSNAEFQGAKFKKRVSFNGAQINGSAIFRPIKFEGEANFRPTKFGGEVNFGSAHIGGTAEFQEAEFKQRANFNRARIQETAYFNAATFKEEADFGSAHIGSYAVFNEAKFKQNISLKSARIEGDTYWCETVFSQNVSFENTSFGTVYFLPPDDENRLVQFEEIAKVDLRGCTYDRIHPISFWEELTKRLKPYERQPFTQLEETFRRAGHDQLANDVYYKRKRRESESITIRSPAWVMDRFLWLLTGYGVRLRRLLIPIIFILLAGMLIFSFVDGALEPKQDSRITTVSESHAKAVEGLSLIRFINSFLISLDLFLPIVDISTVGEWQPSTKTTWGIPLFTILGTFLTLTGWVLVPVAVAGLTGILKR